VDDAPRSGRPSKFDEDEKLEILKDLQKPYASTHSVASKYDTSAATILKIANEDELNFKHFTIIPKLTESHKNLRLKYCKLNVNDDFTNWIFSDECGFKICTNIQGQWTKKEKIYLEKIDKYSTLFIFKFTLILPIF